MRRRAAVSLACLALLLSSCAAPQPVVVAPAPALAPAPAPPEPKNAVVVLPEADGHTGRVTVSNDAGSRTLDSPGSATRIIDARTAPGEPVTLDAAQIEALFGAALAAQPTPPVHFTLYFEQGSTQLTAESRGTLAAIVAAIRERGSVDTSVVGHSDTAGDARMNLELSLRRAMAVGALLAAEGVEQRLLEITSHGEANLLVPTGNDVSEPRNRRVEVTVR